MVNAILAAILSFFIPGLGQALAGDVKKGIIFFVIAILLAIIVNFVFKSFFAMIIDLIYSLYVAYDVIKWHNKPFLFLFFYINITIKTKYIQQQI